MFFVGDKNNGVCVPEVYTLHSLTTSEKCFVFAMFAAYSVGLPIKQLAMTSDPKKRALSSIPPNSSNDVFLISKYYESTAAYDCETASQTIIKPGKLHLNRTKSLRKPIQPHPNNHNSNRHFKHLTQKPRAKTQLTHHQPNTSG